MSEQFQQFLPIFIPCVAIALILASAALMDLRKQLTTRGPKWMWAVIIIVFSGFIGPLAYFVIGRKEE